MAYYGVHGPYARVSDQRYHSDVEGHGGKDVDDGVRWVNSNKLGPVFRTTAIRGSGAADDGEADNDEIDGDDHYGGESDDSDERVCNKNRTGELMKMYEDLRINCIKMLPHESVPTIAP